MTDVEQVVRVQEIEHQWITMADGVRLSARLWLPEFKKKTPTPAILEYIPYRKRDMVRPRDQRNHPFFAQNGYAAIRVDMRGSGDSEGSMPDMYSADELDDTVAVINWIAGQPWCNGRVGMMGTSWGGTSSLQAAARTPDPLKAIIAVCATNNRFDDDIHHMGGCLLTDTVEWGATLPAILASPPDSATVGPKWRDIWLKRLEKLAFPLENWIRHESRDEFWRHGSVDEAPDAIRCPVLMIGGWADRYSNTVMNFLARHGAQRWGIVGPWGHHYPDQGVPGPAMGFQQEALRWWDHWLKGVDNKVESEPRLRVWMQEYAAPANFLASRPGRWTSEAQWPSGNIAWHHYHVADHKLSLQPSKGGGELAVPWSLRAGESSGDTGYFGRSGGLPLDQRDDAEHSIVLHSDPLDEGFEVLGAVSLRTVVKASHRVATVVARLSAVHPDGSVARVAYAVRNLALSGDGELLGNASNTGEQAITLLFHNTAWRFSAGHRIRLTISSSYWPLIWPSPAPVDLTLYADKTQLVLPVREVTRDDGETAVAAAEPTGDTTHEMIAAPALERWTEADTGAESVRTCWRQPIYRVYHPDIDLEFGFETEACHSIAKADPVSAISRFEHTLHFSRRDTNIMVTGIAELRATATRYLIRGELIVIENEEVVFQRKWQPEIPRTCS